MLKELDFNNKKEIDKIKKYIDNQKNNDYTQSIEWNIIRNENEKFLLYYEVNNIILWHCNVLVKNSKEGNVAYIPRVGISFDNKNIVETFFEKLTKWAVTKKYFKIVLNTYLTKESELEYIPKNIKYSITEKNNFISLYDSYKQAFMNIINNEDILLSKLSKNHRRNVRKSYKNDLNFKISPNIDINKFYKLYLETAKRHNFIPHNLEYFNKIINTFKKNIICIEVSKNNVDLAMTIDIIYKNKLVYLYGVSADNNKKNLAMYLLHWEAIKFCIKNKIEKYDFGGVFCDENDFQSKDYGLYMFKKGFCYDGFLDVLPDITINLKND